jgi:hypothetical protein|tara:strand:- start:2217 stop:2444 length:228 start_codon:yes stop_codon:yes gene_type:complete
MEGMTFDEARDIAEGLIEYDDPKIIVAAWQFLIDNNMIRRLDGWFRSSSQELIELGICRPPRRRNHRHYRSNNRR